MWRYAWLVAVCATFGIAHGAPVGSVATIDRTVARVGDAVIWESEVTVRVAADQKTRTAVLDELIDDELIIAEGRKALVTVDPSEVQAALTEIKTQNNLDEAAFVKALADAGYTKARYERELERQLMLLRTKNQLIAPLVVLTDADVAAEGKARKLKTPLSEQDKETIAKELRSKQFDAHTATWIADLRKRALIERRP